MNILFIYMVKVGVYLIAFYLVYSILLSRDTLYGRNRGFILLSFIMSLVLPLITFQTIKPLDVQVFGKLLSEVFVTAESNGKASLITDTLFSNPLQAVYSVYFIGIIVLVLKLIIDFINLLFLILRRKSTGSRIIRFHGFNTSGFSAMGHIFINSRLANEEAVEIIRHEQNHLRQNHFIDIVFIELVKAFQWFNPIVYLFNRSLRAVHEYQADQECLSSGVSVVNYQSLLMTQVFKSGAFNLTNSFSNPSLMKKRMIMMTKKRTSSIAGIKLFTVIPAAGLVFLAISAYKEIPSTIEQMTTSLTGSKTQIESQVKLSPVTSTNDSDSPDTKSNIVIPPPPPPPPPPPAVSENTDNIKTEETEPSLTATEEPVNSEESTPFVVVEKMPMFPGGPMELLKYISQNTSYPEASKSLNIQGRVIIRFCVTAEGTVNRVSVLKGVSPELDEEALRVVKTLPVFEPGMQAGKAVPVWYMVPITFTLK